MHKYLTPLFLDEALMGSQHTALRAAVHDLLTNAMPAAIEVAADALARAYAAGAPPLAPSLLLAVLLYHGSDPSLLPTSEAVTLARGLEDITTTYNEAAWERAEVAATDLAKKLARPLQSIETGTGPGDLWTQWRAPFFGQGFLADSLLRNVALPALEGTPRGPLYR